MAGDGMAWASLTLAETAESQIGVVEVGGDNRGPKVDEYCRTLNTSIGHAWCAAFVAWCIRQTETRLGGKCGLELSEHVLTLWGSNPGARIVPGEHRIGDVVIWQHGASSTGHCGIVVAAPAGSDFFTTVEGNTSDAGPGIEREGDGVFKKSRHVKPVGSNMRLLGFLRPFPE